LEERVKGRSAASRERVGRRCQIDLLPSENCHPFSRRTSPLELRQMRVTVERFDVSKQAEFVN